MQRRIRKLTDADDPYRELKQRANQVVLAALPKLAAEATLLRLTPGISRSAAA